LERRFLLACLAGKARRPDPGLDWSRFLDRALQNGVAALAYARLRDSGGLELLPQRTAADLRRNYVSTGFRNLGCMEELGRVLAALRAADIPTIALKGAAFAGSLWSDPAVRTMRDFDLLVPRPRLEAAESVLRERGYLPSERYTRAGLNRRDHHHGPPMKHPVHGLVVEIHWNIVKPHEEFRFSPDKLWARAVETRIAGYDALTLSPEDHILHLCLHTACDDPFQSKIGSIIDMAELLRAGRQAWDWDTLLEEAAAEGYARFLYYPLHLAGRLFRAPVPADVLRALRRSAGMGIAEDRLVRSCAERCLLAAARDDVLLAEWRLSRACEIMLFNEGTLKRFYVLCGEVCSTLAHAAAKRRRTRSTRPSPRAHPAAKDGRSR